MMKKDSPALLLYVSWETPLSVAVLSKNIWKIITSPCQPISKIAGEMEHWRSCWKIGQPDLDLRQDVILVFSAVRL
ncbi:hypothetical protein GOODEAATRI_021794 [Goodea atripinnis]|uniref:Uncharacterized protein n=1 Tax=Goodea atripinnis TaxID=208336 RepID=A0ABV0MJR9_9TELE